MRESRELDNPGQNWAYGHPWLETDTGKTKKGSCPFQCPKERKSRATKLCTLVEGVRKKGGREKGSLILYECHHIM